MKKFEYTVLEIPSKGFWGYKVDDNALTTRLNELGNKGWEVATMATGTNQGTSHGVIILKKEIGH